ncbi:MAG: DsbA family oxidoreductase [Solirubrobacterales bacterium]
MLKIRHFTDPGCPWAFSAEPAMRRLEWFYGDHIEWTLTMVVLARRAEDYIERGLTAARFARQLPSFQTLGMPIDARERSRMHGTGPACRAVVAAGIYAPDCQMGLLRRLRVLVFAGDLIDDPGVIDLAAQGAGIDPGQLRQWMDADAVEQRFEADHEAARDPSAAARAWPEKLAAADDSPCGYRYTCPALEIAGPDDGRIDIPGIHPTESYELVAANLLPGVTRRSAPQRVEDVLEWAPFPLATVEVAGLLGVEHAQARERLARVAREDAVGSDGYWSLG